MSIRTRYALFFASAMIPLTASAGTPFVPVVVAGQSTNQTGPISDLTSLTINNAGVVAFRASYIDASAGDSTGAFLAGGSLGGVNRVAGTGQAAPGTSAFFSGGFVFTKVNHAGQVAMTVSLQGGDVVATNNSAIYAGAPGSLALTAREGAQAPGLPTGVLYRRGSTSSPFSAPVLFNHSNQVAFTAALSGTGITVYNSSAFFVGNAESVQPLARAGDAAPGLPGMTYALGVTSAVYPSLGPVLNDNGHVLFRSTLRDSNLALAGNALFSGPLGAVQLVAKNGQAAPELPGVTFGSEAATSLAINNANQIALATTLTGAGVNDLNDQAVYGGTPGNLRVIMREDDSAPGMTTGVRFDNIVAADPIVMNANGRVVFQSMLRGGDVTGPYDDRAIFTGTSRTDVQKIVRLGEAAADVSDMAVYRSIYGVALNAHGQAAFLAELGGNDPGVTPGYGIFSFDPLAGVRLVARTGDNVPLGNGETGTIRSFAFNDESGGQDGRLVSLNDQGQIAFTMGLVGGSSAGGFTQDGGLFLASVVSAGDATRDGRVDFDDLLIVAQHYDLTAQIWSTGDFTADGLVNFDDLLILAQHYQTNPAAFEGAPTGIAADWALARSLAPEPATFVGFAGLAPLMRRRR